MAGRTPAEQAKLDAFYKDRFGFDPSQVTPEAHDSLEKELERMRPTRGVPVFGKNDPVLQARANYVPISGRPHTSRDAQALAVYDAWKNGELPPDVDALTDELLSKHKIAGAKADEYKSKRDAALKDWVAEKAGAYNHLVPTPDDAKKSDKEEREIVMEPEEITSNKGKKPKAPPEPPAAALPAAGGQEGQAPPPGIAAPPDEVPAALAPSPSAPPVTRVERDGTTIRRIPAGGS